MRIAETSASLRALDGAFAVRTGGTGIEDVAPTAGVSKHPYVSEPLLKRAHRVCKVQDTEYGMEA